MKKWMRALSLGLIITLGSAAAGTTLACPMCKDSISDTARSGNTAGRGAEQGLPSGFNFSVYYMLIGLFVTMGVIGGVVTKGILSANASMKRRGFDVR
jgi:hypothetical protein